MNTGFVASPAAVIVERRMSVVAARITLRGLKM
jgi:hypothetical protein